MNTKGSPNSKIDVLNEDFAFKINIALLFIHIGLFLAFALIGAPVMVFINIISISIYLLTLRLVKKKVALFLEITYCEVLIHMIAAAICMGWECGFQLYCFVVLPLIYYAHNISRKSSEKPFPHTLLVCIVLLCFFFVRICSIYYPPIYDILNDTAAIVIFVINSCVVFAFLIVFLSLYENMGHNIEIILKQNAEYDSLTGLANRYKMNEHFNTLIDSKTLEATREFSIGIIDIDNFKRVNDTYGHNFGDLVLKNVANIMKQSENEHTHSCRWGGEEFLIVVDGANSLDTLSALLEFIRIKVANAAITYEDTTIHVTFSSGVALHREGEKLTTTISRSDAYLYTAKKFGKNRVYTEDSQD